MTPIKLFMVVFFFFSEKGKQRFKCEEVLIRKYINELARSNCSVSPRFPHIVVKCVVHQSDPRVLSHHADRAAPVVFPSAVSRALSLCWPPKLLECGSSKKKRHVKWMPRSRSVAYSSQYYSSHMKNTWRIDKTLPIVSCKAETLF